MFSYIDVYFPAIPYEVTVWTGDVANAGTDARVFLQIYGVNGKKTEEKDLRNKTDNFEQGQVDKFKVKNYIFYLN